MESVPQLPLTVRCLVYDYLPMVDLIKVISSLSKQERKALIRCHFSQRREIRLTLTAHDHSEVALRALAYFLKLSNVRVMVAIDEQLWQPEWHSLLVNHVVNQMAFWRYHT